VHRAHLSPAVYTSSLRPHALDLSLDIRKALRLYSGSMKVSYTGSLRPHTLDLSLGIRKVLRLY